MTDYRRQGDEAFRNLLASNDDAGVFDDSFWIALSFGIGLPAPPSKAVGGFRGKLLGYTGKTAEVVAESQAHHMLPLEFKDRFKALNLAPDDSKYGVWWETADHLSKAKQYNAQWRVFLADFERNFGRKLTEADVRDQAERMAIQYHLDWVRPQ